MAVSSVDGRMPEEELENIFKKLHLSSRVLAAFPFKLQNEEYKTSFAGMAYTIGSLLFFGFAASNASLMDSGNAGHVLRKLSKPMPHLAVFAVLLVNVLWLLKNREAMTYVYRTLKEILIKERASLGFRHRYMRVFCVLAASEMQTAYSGEETRPSEDYGVLLFVFLVTFAVVDQFSSLLKVIMLFYAHICDNLDPRTAERFTDVHDLLARCCSTVNRCYSPQLLAVTLTAVVYIVALVYNGICQFKDRGTFDQQCLSATLLFFAVVMHFTRSCRLTKLESARFNKLLYRLIINDDSKKLIRNKRIMLHFKGMKELEFKAIGIINIDYPLICSMVSTATTYILILVQFSN